MSDAPHIPVLLGEVLEALEPAPGKLIIDGTFGAGGYSRALLEAGADVLALDRDPAAARYAEPLKASGHFTLVETRFSQLARALADADAVVRQRVELLQLPDGHVEFFRNLDEGVALFHFVGLRTHNRGL